MKDMISKKMVGMSATVLLLLVLYIAVIVMSGSSYLAHSSLKFPPLNGSPRNTFVSHRNMNLSQYKTILLWNQFFGQRDFYFGVGHTPFIRAGCPVNSCFITFDRTVYPIEYVDAVIWHARDGDLSFPHHRARHTRYVFFLEESPFNSNLDLMQYNQVFNYTMTYRRDSDVYLPYGRFYHLQTLQRTTPFHTNTFTNKTVMAAWFVSNCNSHSNRETLVERLQAHIQVDVYGKCGSFKCSSDKTSECLEMLQQRYWFYLAFENSLCQDYITEKFFKLAKYNVVPVVYGLGPYEQIGPPHSYINVLDYNSVKDLADHMTYLSRNVTAYAEYFRWREDYGCSSDTSAAWCDLCKKLHTDTKQKTYDIYDWFEKGRPGFETATAVVCLCLTISG
ncbi:Fucosyltransferase N-terminal [Trinorchestia longiramus]|nr:Fucosyltransferase N-terminal [Trinorchestia longiramus]